jgi:hypothetical protein
METPETIFTEEPANMIHMSLACFSVSNRSSEIWEDKKQTRRNEKKLKHTTTSNTVKCIDFREDECSGSKYHLASD